MERQAAAAAARRPAVVVLGAFDGVHRGHQELLRGAVARAHELGAHTAAVTFDPDPEHVLRPQQAPPNLTTLDDRVTLIRALGIGEVCVWQFTPQVAQMSPEAFVEALCARYRLVEAWVGDNFRFGHARAGSADTLTELGTRHGFAVRSLSAVYDGDGPISSTRVRELLLRGDVRGAAHLLGRAYRLHGEVQSGAQRGRQLGFPTANLAPPAGLLVPEPGVYAGWANCGGATHGAVANLGSRPTFDEQQPLLEVHLLDWSGDLYGRPLSFDFVERVRPIEKFASLDALKAQIAADSAAARALLAGEPKAASGDAAG